MNGIGEGVVTILSLIVGIAAISVIVSPKAKTSEVIQATASGFVNSLATAEAPVTGSQVNIVSSYPSSGFGMPSLDMSAPFMH
jgi:hypothetical protein